MGCRKSFLSWVLEAWYVNGISGDNKKDETNKTFNLTAIGTSLAIALGVLLAAFMSIHKGIVAMAPGLLVMAALSMVVLGLLGFILMNDQLSLKNSKTHSARGILGTFFDIKQAFIKALDMRFLRFVFLTFAYGLCFVFLRCFGCLLALVFLRVNFK